jgi:hypothetical protein
MRVLLDTNVVVSALLFGGEPRALLGEPLLASADQEPRHIACRAGVSDGG